jgi:hypothetical protein
MKGTFVCIENRSKKKLTEKKLTEKKFTEN